MIELWRSVDAEARAVRKAYEDGVEAPMRNATERIARARFAALGTSVYPDATFTLRLNYGTVQGWNENGTQVEPFTRLSRAFERATGADPFRIPDSWLRVKDKLDMSTPFNLSTNNDIVGGNSGSPLINARGELVGPAVRWQYPLDLRLVLVRYREESRDRRSSGHHARSPVEGLFGRRAARRADEVIDRGQPPSYSCALTSKRTCISSSTTRLPIATLNGLRPSCDWVSGNSPRAMMAPSRRVAPARARATPGSAPLSVTSTPASKPSSGRADIRGTQPDRRVVRPVEQRRGQQVGPRPITRALRHARREIRARGFAQCRFIDRELVDRQLDVEACGQRIVGQVHHAREVVRGDDVVVPETGHGAAAIHQDLQQRFLGADLELARPGRDGEGCRVAGCCAGVWPVALGGLSDTRPAPIARRKPQQSGNPRAGSRPTHRMYLRFHRFDPAPHPRLA